MLSEAVARNPRVIADLSDLMFIDCESLGVLVRARTRAREAGGDLVLAGARGKVWRVLALPCMSVPAWTRRREKDLTCTFHSPCTRLRPLLPGSSWPASGPCLRGGQAAPRRMRRAALGGISRWWVRPSMAARQEGQSGSRRRPQRAVSLCRHPGPAQATPGLGFAHQGAKGSGVIARVDHRSPGGRCARCSDPGRARRYGAGRDAGRCGRPTSSAQIEDSDRIRSPVPIESDR